MTVRLPPNAFSVTVPELSDVSVPFFQVILPAVAAFAAIGAVIVFAVSRSLVRPQFAGQEGMLGTVLTVDSDIDPTGRVFGRGEFWNAEAEQRIPAGERVRVTAVHDLVLRVAPMSDEGEGNA